MSEFALEDPFGLTANLAAYVSRPATERALTELMRSLREGVEPTAVTGPPGLGKTLLLHVLADRLGQELRCIYVPYAALAPAELSAWVIDALGAPRVDDPVAFLRAYVAHLREACSALLLLIDDAGALPLESTRWLGRIASEPGHALRLALAAADGVPAGRTIAAIAPTVHVVRLIEPMSESETREYVGHRLRMARVTESIRERFDADMVGRLHYVSGGNPRRLHTAASAVMRGRSPDPIGDLLDDAPIFDALGMPHVPRPISGFEGSVAEPGTAARAEPVPYTERRAPPPRRRETRLAPTPSRQRVFASALGVALVVAAVPVLRGSLGSAPPGAREVSAASPPVVAAVGPATVPAAEPAPAREVAAAAPAAPTAAPVPVNINAAPWATVEVDGVDVGVTPISGLPLLAGTHHFRARMPDGRTLEREVEIDPDRRFVAFE